MPRSVALFVGLCLCALPSTTSAAVLPAGFSESLIASGLSSPTAMQFAPDGRLFVCEQAGRLRVIKDGALLPTPFLTLPVSSAGERGLLGVAFDPAFATNGFVYVYYTATSPAVHNRISRFTANGDVAVAGSEVVLVELDNLSSATNHNGGALAFGADGMLYAAVGENANPANAQSMNNLLGKMLRINRDGTIPTNNPFYTTATGKNRAIWALGLRNPFTFAFNPAGPEMFINDVGQNTWEEINDGRIGANYGWPDTEGPTTDPRFDSPRYAYTHSSGGCAITGGSFYAPLANQFPSSYWNDYFFADYCGGWVRTLDPAAGNSIATFATGIPFPVDLKVADDGSLYYLARGSGPATGVVYRVRSGNTAPSITAHPANRSVAAGGSATFSVGASGTPTLRYQWQRNGASIGGATAQDYAITSVVQADNGARFRAIVTNDFGSATSNEALLTVTANQPPVGTITQPAAGTTYAGGTLVNYAGTGTDTQDGTLPASAFTWRVDFHHDTHTHPFIAPTSGARSGSFTIPTTGETSANVWYRLYLTVRDSAGLVHTSQRDILPRKVQLTLTTVPAGLQLRLDGQPVATPFVFDSVVGIVRGLQAPTPQTSGSSTYEFVSWSDSGAASHTISTPATGTTYGATYHLLAGGTGNGLSATYYDNMNFTGTMVTRIDPTVDFVWGAGSPAATIGPDTFSVRWTGQVEPPSSGTYTFYTQSDDGVRLWVADQLIVNNWTNHAPTENSGTIALTAGQRYSIRMEFYENGGGATARLSWSHPAVPKQIVPATRLYSQGSSGLTPYRGTPVVIPGIVQAEEFDHGGPEIAYRDTTAGNAGGQFRTTDVDIERTPDGVDDHNVGWMAAGEWLVYSIDVTAAGSYTFEARVAAAGAGGTFHVEVNGSNVTGPMSIPNTGGWQNWTTIVKTGISLPAGRQTLRVVLDANGSSGVFGNLNYLRISAASAPPPPPPPPGDIVIYASDLPGTAWHGAWTAQTGQAGSPNGVKLVTPDQGTANINAPLAAPIDYVDVTFAAGSGTAYTLWLRLKAVNNSKYNDAVWVQFSDARVNGSPVFPLNSTSGLMVNLATDSSASSLNGWGWQNRAYWLSQPATFTFAASGSHTLRIQVREDGVQFDQIVLSPTTYRTSPPGPPTNDSTIVPK
jgi:glucose/arabinose dehydrogenase